MNLKECYEAIGVNYDDVLKRLMNEKIVRKFALKFLDDNNFDVLKQSMEAKDVDSAFRASHTIKGICLNLGFTELYDSVHELTEALRAKDYDKALALFPDTEKNYSKTVSVIKQLDPQ